MRTLGVDLHKRFAEVAVCEDGEVRRSGRVEMEDLDAFAASLGPDDHVVVESTSVTWAVVSLLERHAGRVTVSNPMRTKAIASAKVKTDKVDARVLAQLGAADFIAEVWVPDADTRAMRRRLAHRRGLVVARTALRNQVHAILDRNLVGSLGATDLFGKKGRAALDSVELPGHEREQVECALRLHDALQAEIAHCDQVLAAAAVEDEDVQRLMTIPGVGWITALSLTSVAGDIGRFATPRHLVGYLGLDPRVRQSGDGEARTGHISRQGQAHARAMLVEAAHAAVKTPGPLRAFFLRVKARRGHQVALLATARKICVYAWQLLTKGEDYRYQAPSLTQRKRRELKVRAGVASPRAPRGSVAHRRDLERELLEQVERNYLAIANRPARAAPDPSAATSGG